MVAKFLKIRKDEKNDLNPNVRKTNRARAGAYMGSVGDGLL